MNRSSGLAVFWALQREREVNENHENREKEQEDEPEEEVGVRVEVRNALEHGSRFEDETGSRKKSWYRRKGGRTRWMWEGRKRGAHVGRVTLDKSVPGRSWLIMARRTVRERPVSIASHLMHLLPNLDLPEAEDHLNSLLPSTPLERHTAFSAPHRRL
jgi:hypothetical protein